MRILVCNYEYPPLGGGGGVFTALLAQELAHRHEVTLLTSQAFDLPTERLEAGVRVLRVPVHFRGQTSVASFASMLGFLPAGIRAGRRLLDREHFDVINTHFVVPTGPVGDALASYAGIPNVLSLHGGDLYDPSKATSPHRNPLLRAWIRRLLQRADLVVGQSTNTLDNARHFYSRDLAGVRVPLGIRPPPDGCASRAAYGFGTDDIIFVTIGRLVRRKAIDQLLLVVNQLRSQGVRLLIVGSGPQEMALRSEVSRLHLAENVRFLGQVDETDKFRILRMSDAYVSTAQHEGFGLTFVEAMASGLPVVSYDRGGQTDFLRDGQTGFVVPLNDLAAFTESCRCLAADAHLRRQLGQRNKALARDYFIDRCTPMYEDLFQSVLPGSFDDPIHDTKPEYPMHRLS